LLFSTLQKNKKKFIAYNDFRKNIFLQNSVKDAPVILYMLPWLLSVNRLSVPGYIKDLKEPFHVFNIENEREILKKEVFYKRMYEIREEKSLIRQSYRGLSIHGLYTIGSVGTISQTSHSDCDIWICYDRNDYDDKSLLFLNQKLNIIKDWMDAHLKMPVYFFLSDISDIRKCNFGNMDFESCGSTQRNVLKEEFYRTAIMICGKIPFWWLCYDDENTVNYDKELENYLLSDMGAPDVIDLGNLEQVEQNEYYGAALWQFNKSLTHPLKSIIKMLQLKMFLESSEEELLCHKFRRLILSAGDKDDFTEPSLFTMSSILDYYAENSREEYFKFIKKFFYLRYDFKMLSKKQTLKEILAADIFKKYKIDRADIYELNEFESWQLQKHIHFGSLMLDFLKEIYKDIVRIQKGKGREIDPQDLKIMGRKLSSSIEKKNHKVEVLHTPVERIKLPVFTFANSGKVWLVNSSDDPSQTVIINEDIIYCLAYIVWNGIYEPVQTRMLPNHSSVTMQEIINLGKTIKEVFGSYNITSVHFGNFLEEEKVIKMLIVISFDNASINMDISDFCVIYKNNWEELFVRRFNSLDKMKAFFEKVGKESRNLDTQFYIQRSNKYYEKIIERTKSFVTRMLASA